MYRRAVDLRGADRAAVLAKASPEVRQEVEAMLGQPSGSKLIDFPSWANEPELRRNVESLIVAHDSGYVPFPNRPASESESNQTLNAGAMLGPYEIRARIGAGGMGEVYQARDTRLNRIVAIKVLPPRLADSAESRDRFEREARMIASLNHPHICTLHDIGHHGEMDFSRHGVPRRRDASLTTGQRSVAARSGLAL